MLKIGNYNIKISCYVYEQKEMLNKKIKSIVSVLLPKGSKRYNAVKKIYRFIFIADDWTIRSDLFMHIKIFFRIILKKLHLHSSEMKRYNDIYKRHDGDRCFIICTGPSLTVNDLELLRNEYTIGVNSIFMAYSETDWRPTYYVAVDYFHLNEMIKRETRNINRLCYGEAFVHSKIKINTQRDIVFPCLINYANHNSKRIRKSDFRMSTDVDVCLYDCFTVTNAAIQIAIYMGFKEIYIIGADCDYSQSKMHFIETEIDKNDRNADWLPNATELSIQGYMAAKKFAESMDVNIYNATRGGKLEVFERADIDNIDLK